MRLPRPVSFRSSSLAAAAALVVALGAHAPPALAQECGMGAVDWYGAERESVAAADTLLREGEPQKAAALLQKMWPRIREAVPVASSNEVIAEGVRLMALAVARADGDVKPLAGWPSATAREREGNVAWAVKRLRMLAAASPGDDTRKESLGEALARSPKTRDEALAILEPMGAANRLATPEGYAALALVRAMKGDAAGAEAAARACERTTDDDDARCTGAGGRVDPTVTAAR